VLIIFAASLLVSFCFCASVSVNSDLFIEPPLIVFSMK
jgi:hypothetical protein